MRTVLTLLVLMSLAIYRVTRFIVADSLIAEPRARVLHALARNSSRRSPWGPLDGKLHDLLACPYCVSVWVTLGVVLGTDAVTSVPLPVLFGMAAAGGAMTAWRFVEE